jgi:putative tryptophan/tyrosine transport system substrate-binding protein
MMKRRAFIILGGAAVACSVRARAQQPAKLPRIGFLGLVPESLAGDGLRAGLRDVGYVEGNNILIEWRWAQNVGELPELAADLARMPVDVIFAPSSTFVEAARHATATIPIISRFTPILSAWVMSQVLRGRAATSQVCRCFSPSSPRKN